MHEDIKEMTKILQKQLLKIDVLKNKAIEQLSEEKRKEISPITEDMAVAMNAIKQGKSEKLNELLNKYAGSNR